MKNAIKVKYTGKGTKIVTIADKRFKSGKRTEETSVNERQSDAVKRSWVSRKNQFGCSGFRNSEMRGFYKDSPESFGEVYDEKETVKLIGYCPLEKLENMTV